MKIILLVVAIAFNGGATTIHTTSANMTSMEACEAAAKKIRENEKQAVIRAYCIER